MIAFPLAFLLALATFILGILVGRQILTRKSIGEAIVANIIASNYQCAHVLLNNVTLKTESGTTQIDHLLIADTGIFVIETKHYQGWIFGDPKQSRWTQVIYKRKSKFQNPLRQNYGHLKTLQSLFTLPDDNFFSLVVFTGDAEFKTDLGPDVVQRGQLIPWLTRERPVLFDERKLAYIVGRIEMKRLRHSLETDEYHLIYVRQKVSARSGGRV